MGRIRRVALSAAFLAGAISFIWSGLLNERARTSVKQAAGATGGLLNRLITLYMTSGVEESEIDDEQNRAWVRQQWKDAGY